MDGVITRTVRLHRAAWRELFRDFLAKRTGVADEDRRPFTEEDYRIYVDGKPRYEGVRAFLASRGIEIPEGTPQDSPSADTVRGLGLRKNQRLLELVAERGVEVDAEAVRLVRELRASGVRVGVATSSENGPLILERAGLADSFDARIDGVVSRDLGLRGKPDPDIFLACARRLGASSAAGALVIEDAESGVAAARAGGFGLVIGIDRDDNSRRLREAGADWIVRSLDEVTMDQIRHYWPLLPNARQDRPDGRARGASTAGGSMELPVHLEGDPTWRIVEEGHVLAREHEIESLFTTSNGFVGSRASLEEGTALSSPATLVAGVFERRPGTSPRLACTPDWTRLVLNIDGASLLLENGVVLEHRRILDLRHGILRREWRQRDECGRITALQSMRLVSLADRHLLLQSVTFTPENYGGVVSVENPMGSPWVSTQAVDGVQIVLMADSWVLHPGGRRASTPSRSRASGGELTVEIGKSYRFDRVVAVHTSRESGPVADIKARETLREVDRRGIHAAIRAHSEAWRKRWDACDVVIDGDPDAERAVRFAMYHLISAANPEDQRTSVGARALTGPAYNGHVFWDTEAFMLPFFTLAYPAAARALLMYRYHTLPAARARAAHFGYRGAFYAWESADTGEDVTPARVLMPTGEVIRIRVGDQEQHVSAAVAYGVFRYWQATGDDQFLLQAGAEILIETARFWASRVRREDDGLHHIRGVIGPDEYHESVDDNAYTNGMAQWNLEVAAEVATALVERWPDRWRELSRQIELSLDETRQWRRIAEAIYTGLDQRSGLIEQFEGYFALEEIDLASYEPRSAPIDVLLGRERIQQSKVLKQPDVVMLLHLLWERFPPHVREANFRYYDARTSHGSSLSPAIHAATAARLGDLDLALRYFRQTQAIDLSNAMGNAAGGVHVGALGGLWQAVVFGFLGLSYSSNGHRIHPRLPEPWTRLRLSIELRGERVSVDVPQDDRIVREVDA